MSEKMTKEEALERVREALGAEMANDTEYMDWCKSHGIQAPLEAYKSMEDHYTSVRVYADHITLITPSDYYSYDIA